MNNTVLIYLPVMIIVCMLVSAIVTVIFRVYEAIKKWRWRKRWERWEEEMNERITYTSENGFTGILYGKSSLAVRDKNGKEVLHTGFRSINTYDELVDYIEGFPEFWKMFTENIDKFLEEKE